MTAGSRSKNCVLPREFRNAAHPAHWDTLLTPVVPPERGIPVLENIFFRRVRAENARICCQISGSTLIRPRNLHFNEVFLQGAKGGMISWAQADEVDSFTVKAQEKLLFDHASTLEKSVGFSRAAQLAAVS